MFGKIEFHDGRCDQFLEWPEVSRPVRKVPAFSQQGLQTPFPVTWRHASFPVPFSYSKRSNSLILSYKEGQAKLNRNSNFRFNIKLYSSQPCKPGPESGPRCTLAALLTQLPSGPQFWLLGEEEGTGQRPIPEADSLWASCLVIQ